MTNFTQQLSKRLFGAAIRVVTLALFLVVFGASAALAQTRGYVTNAFDDTVSVIDPATNTVVATIPVGDGPRGIAVTPNGAFAYTANTNGNTVSVIDTATNTVVATVPVGSSSQGVTIDPNGAFAYVAIANGNTVSKISTTTNTVVATIPVGSGPQYIAFSVRTTGPTDKDQCKDGGWQTFTNPTFKNQGDCVSFVNHMNHVHD